MNRPVAQPPNHRTTQPPRLSRPSQAGWGGAVAGWELTRLARRGSPALARLLVAGLLFVALFVTYLTAFPDDVELLPPGRAHALLSAFGQAFALAFLFIQAAAVLALTPLFVAGGVVEETERRTLEFLLATDLAAREIVLGKLWPRLLLMLTLVLAGWPLLAATQVWGGVDIWFVTFGSLVIVGSAWAAAGISLACAVGAPTFRKALTRSYLWSAVWLSLPVVTCPFLLIAVLADLPAFLVVAQRWLARSGPGQALGGLGLSPVRLVGLLFGLGVLLHFLVGLWGARRACRKMRDVRVLDAGRPKAARPRREKWERHPPVPEEAPFVWKEVYLTGQAARLVRMLGLVPWWLWLGVSTAFMAVGLAAAGSSSGAADIFAAMNDVVRWVGGLFVGLMVLVVGLHAAGSVARERQQNTLDDLLTIPRPRRELVWAKWVGAVARARGIALGALPIPLVGVVADGLSGAAVLPMALAAGAFVACAAAFGLWLSVRTRTVQRATGLWLLLVGLWVGGTFLAAQVAYVEQDRAGRVVVLGRPPPTKVDEMLVWDRVLSPPLAWSELCFRYLDEGEPRDYWWRRDPDGRVDHLVEVWPSLAGAALYGVLAWAFYRAARRGFERRPLPP